MVERVDDLVDRVGVIPLERIHIVHEILNLLVRGFLDDAISFATRVRIEILQPVEQTPQALLWCFGAQGAAPFVLAFCQMFSWNARPGDMKETAASAVKRDGHALFFHSFSMADVYMERGSSAPSNNSAVTAITIVVLAILAALFFIYALPAMRASTTVPAQQNTAQPENTTEAPGASGSIQGSGSVQLPTNGQDGAQQ